MIKAEPQVGPLTDESGVTDWIDIFRAGQYGEDEKYTEADLDLIVERYDPKKDEAPVVVDHDEWGPARGWVAAIQRVGRRLQAKFRDLDLRFQNEIKERRYAKRSVSFNRDPLSLRHVAWLGAGKPRIKGMPDPVYGEGADSARCVCIEFSESPGDCVTEKPPLAAGPEQDPPDTRPTPPEPDIAPETTDFSNSAGQQAPEPTRQGGHPMTEKTKDGVVTPAPEAKAPEVTADQLAAEFAKKLASAEARFAESEAARKRDAQKIDELRRDRADARFEASFSDALSSGRITPAVKDKARALVGQLAAFDDDDGAQPIEFSDGGEVKKTKLADLFWSFVGALPKAVDFSEQTPQNESSSGKLDLLTVDFSDPEKRAEAVRQYMIGKSRELGQSIDYAEASRMLDDERYAAGASQA